jgi:hypothetical protein
MRDLNPTRATRRNRRKTLIPQWIQVIRLSHHERMSTGRSSPKGTRWTPNESVLRVAGSRSGEVLKLRTTLKCSDHHSRPIPLFEVPLAIILPAVPALRVHRARRRSPLPSWPACDGRRARPASAARAAFRPALARDAVTMLRLARLARHAIIFREVSGRPLSTGGAEVCDPSPRAGTGFPRRGSRSNRSRRAN